MRPRQWLKNAFVFAALIFDRQVSLHNFIPLARSAAAFLLFIALSSVVYIINDVLDVEADRLHPTKRNRPIASGKLKPVTALIFALILTAIALPVAYLLSEQLALVAAIYFLVNLLYSKWLKHIPLLDVLILASCFVLRVEAGVAVIHVQRFSPWLYLVTTLLALYIGLGKRRAELILLEGKGSGSRRVLEGYNLTILDHLITIVSSSTILTYSLYTFSAPNLPDDHIMMLTIPFVMYGVFRYLYLIHVKQEGGAPEELFLTDHPLQFDILLYGAVTFSIFYFLR